MDIGKCTAEGRDRKAGYHDEKAGLPVTGAGNRASTTTKDKELAEGP